MRTLKHQAGLTITGWLITILVAGFALLCAFRMVPAYLDNRYIQQSLKTLAQEPELDSLTNGEIRKNLTNFFNINNIRSVSVRDVLDIDRRQGRILINMSYEVRVPIIHNIDVVMTFDNMLDTSTPDLCCKPIEDTSE